MSQQQAAEQSKFTAPSAEEPVEISGKPPGAQTAKPDNATPAENDDEARAKRKLAEEALFAAYPRFYKEILPEIRKSIGDDCMFSKNFAEILENAQIKKKKDNYLELMLQNGVTIGFQRDEKTGEHTIKKTTGKFDQLTAMMMIAGAKDLGWKKIDIKGPDAQREVLWLQAYKQGLTVGNFIPHLESPIWNQLDPDPEKIKGIKSKIVADFHGKSPLDSKFVEDKPAETAPKEETVKAPAKAEAAPPAAAAPEAAKPVESKIFIPETYRSRAASTSQDGFSSWIDDKMATAKTSEEKEGLDELKSALKSGKLKMDDLQKDIFKSKYDSTLVDVKGKAMGGYSNAIADVENIAQAQKVDIKLPKPQEVATPTASPIVVATTYKSRSNGL